MNRRKIAQNIPYMEIAGPTFYIINQYRIAGFSLGWVFILFIVFWTLYKKKSISLFRPLVYCVLFMLVHDLLEGIFASVNIFLWLEWILFILLIGCVYNNVDREKLYKSWKVVGFIAMIGMYIQAIQVYILGQSVGMIKILPIATSEARTFDLKYMRPHSIFLEPSAYAMWIMPLLCMALVKKQYVFSVLVVVSVLLSSSTIGIVFVMGVMVYYALNSFKRTETRRYSMFIITMLMIGYIAFTNISLFSSGLEKASSVSKENSSNYVRLFLGYDLYNDSKTIYKLFGIPYESVKDYLLSNEVDLNIYHLSRKLYYLGFVNGISNSLLLYGLFTTIVYIYMYYRMYRGIEDEMKMYMVICILGLFVESVFFTANFVTQVMFITAYLKRDESVNMVSFGAKTKVRVD